MKKYSVVLLLFVLLLAMHLPFISADPDSNISWSRGPFTDEGLYSEQIRNYINHDTFNLFESDQFFKSPLFSCIILLPLTIFGTHLIVARLTVLILVILILFFSHRQVKVKWLIPVLLVCGMLQYYIFHYSHFSLPEMLSTAFIILGVVFLRDVFDSDGREYRSVFISSTAICVAWLIKIQFIYMIFLVPSVCGVLWFLERSKSNKKSLYLLVVASLIALVYLLAYFFVWIYPNMDFIEIVRRNQSGEISLTADTPAIIEGNFKKYFFVKELFVFSIITIMSFVAGWIIWFQSKVSWFRSLFLITVIWMTLEFHKLTMSYLPSRYLVSTLFSMALLMALVVTYQLSYWKKWKLLVPIATIMLLFILNMTNYATAFQNRTYIIKEVNQYLSMYDFGTRPVIGAWAGTCNWDSKAITFPVWKEGYNDVNPIQTFNPAMVISEIDEEDSGFAYQAQGIELSTISDSVKQFKIARWTIQLHWIKQP